MLRGKGKEVQLQWAGDFIETDSRFGSAVVDLEASYTKLQQYLNGQNDFNSDQVPSIIRLTQGFIEVIPKAE